LKKIRQEREERKRRRRREERRWKVEMCMREKREADCEKKRE
jgi:hypothetical protein